MSSFFDMISAFIAFLMTAAFLHFGAADDSALRDAPAPSPIVAQSHSESTMSPDMSPPGPAGAEDAATPVDDTAAQPAAPRHSA